jgi:glutathione S-transferase
LADRTWIMGDIFTIADIATFPWVRNLTGFYEAGDLVGNRGLPARHKSASNLPQTPCGCPLAGRRPEPFADH